MNRAGEHQGGGGPPPLTALLLVTRDWQKNPISREIKRLAMRDSDHRARLDERKPKTMFLHRSKVTEEVVKSASQLLTWLTDPASSPSKTKYGRAQIMRKMIPIITLKALMCFCQLSFVALVIQ